MTTEHWKDKPEPQDYPAAESYLSLLMEPEEATRVVEALQAVDRLDTYKAKDVLRASGLPLLAADNKHVASDLAKVPEGPAKVSGIALGKAAAFYYIRLRSEDAPHMAQRRLP